MQHDRDFWLKVIMDTPVSLPPEKKTTFFNADLIVNGATGSAKIEFQMGYHEDTGTGMLRKEFDRAQIDDVIRRLDALRRTMDMCEELMSKIPPLKHKIDSSEPQPPPIPPVTSRSARPPNPY